MELTLGKATEIMERRNGHLNLRGSNVTRLPAGLTVDSWLDLHGTPITHLPEGLKVGGDLYLDHTHIASLPDDLTVCRSLYLQDTPITCLPEGLTVGGSLRLGRTGITVLPDDLTVGYNLELYDTGVTVLPENLTVGCGLDLRRTAIADLPGSLKVGGWIARDGTGAAHPGAHKLRNGEYAEGRYLYADGILTHVKKTRTLKGYTFFVGRIPGKNVVSDGKRYAHCDTLREGIADLLYKSAGDRGAERYRGVPLDEERTVEELMAMYRVITGACRQGTQTFVDGFGNDLKDRYTVREAITLTKGQYGADLFAAFFGAA